MTPKALVVALVGLGCIGAAGVGAYLAVRSADRDPVAAMERTTTQVAATTPAPPVAAAPATPAPVPGGAGAADSEPRSPRPAAASTKIAAAPSRRPRSSAPVATAPGRTGTPSTVASAPAPPPEIGTTISAETLPDVLDTTAGPVTLPAPPSLERTVPADSVIGIRLESGVSSETSRVEDRVLARVTRDVKIDGQTAIPSGARLEGYVNTVDRGGKMRGRARVGVRFTTLVLSDDEHVPVQTETIFRDGEPPSNEATSKIGASAVVGAILGAVIGGRKGAAIGGTAGAAGGTAAVMAGDRNEASIPAGSPLTVRLTAPVTLLVPQDR
jgi:uncharacterized membrane protein